MHLGKTLLTLKSKYKKCCLYETPYVAEPIWVLGEVIAKFSAIRTTSYRCTYKSQFFFGSQVTRFWRDPSRHIKTPMWNFSRRPTSKSGTKKDYLLCYLRSPAKSTFKCLCKQTLLWHVIMSKTPQKPWRSRWPWERDVEQSAPTHVHHTHGASRLLGTTADRRYNVPWDWLRDTCQMARVHWGTAAKDFVGREVHTMKWTKCKEPTGMRTSAESAWGNVQKLSTDKQHSTFIQEFWNPLGIPCPSCTAFT